MFEPTVAAATPPPPAAAAMANEAMRYLRFMVLQDCLFLVGRVDYGVQCAFVQLDFAESGQR